MNKNAKWLAIAGAVVVAAVIVAVAVAAGRKHNTDDGKINTGKSSDMSSMNNSTGSSSGTGSSSDSSSGAASTSKPTATNSVAIKDFLFGPTNITVKVGDTVTWTNNDTVAHTVTADSGSSDGPNSGNIAPGATYSFKFTKAATYIYHCAIHPNMQGSVTVTE